MANLLLPRKVSPTGATRLIDFPDEIDNLVVDTDSAGDSVQAVNTSVTARGRSDSLALTSGSSGITRVDFPVTFRTDGANQLLFRWHQPNGSSVAVITLLISTTSNFAANTWASFNITGSDATTDPSTGIDGWFTATLDLDNPDGGGLPAGENHEFVRFRVQVSQQSEIIYLDQLATIKNSKPLVCVVFDDASETWHTRARSIINDNNIPVTFASIPDSWGNANNITQAQALDLLEDGHRFCLHWTENWSAGEATWIADAQANIDEYNSIINANPSTWGARSDQIRTDVAVLPGGAGERGVSDVALAGIGVKYARTIQGPLSSVSNKVALSGLDEPYAFRGYNPPDSLAATALSWLDARVSEGFDFICLTFHIINDDSDPVANSTEMLETQFDTYMQGLATRRTNGDIVIEYLATALDAIESSSTTGSSQNIIGNTIIGV